MQEKNGYNKKTRNQNTKTLQTFKSAEVNFSGKKICTSTLSWVKRILPFNYLPPNQCRKNYIILKKNYLQKQSQQFEQYLLLKSAKLHRFSTKPVKNKVLNPFRKGFNEQKKVIDYLSLQELHWCALNVSRKQSKILFPVITSAFHNKYLSSVTDLVWVLQVSDVFCETLWPRLHLCRKLQSSRFLWRHHWSKSSGCAGL